MSLVLGLDIGTRTLTGAVFSGTAKKFRLVDFFVEEIPSIGDQPRNESGEYVPILSLEELLAKIVAERGLKAAEVIASIDMKDCIIREFAVPFTKDDQIRKMIHFEAEEHFHTLDVENVVLEYLKVGESNGKSQLIVAAARHEILESRLGLLKKVDLDPLAIDLDAAALFNAFALTHQFDPKKTILLVDMGAASAKAVLIEGGRLKRIRSLRTAQAVLSPDRMIPEPALAGAGATSLSGDAAGGAADLDFGEYSIETRFQEIENALRKLEPVGLDDPHREPLSFSETPIAILSDEDYERVHADHPSGAPARVETGREGAGRPGPGPIFPGGPSGSDGSEMSYRAYLERVGAEVQRTFATNRSPIELICLTGGMSGREEASRFFSEEFDVETAVLDFGMKLPTTLPPETLEKVNLQGGVAVGLAVKELGGDLTGLDFRKGKFRYEHRFARLKIPLLVGSFLLVAFFFQTALWSYHDYLSFSEKTAAMENELGKVFEAFFGRKVSEGRSPLSAAQEQKKKWQGKGVGEVGRVIDCVDAIRNCGEVMNSANMFFTINNMKFELKVKPGVVSGGKKSPPKGEESLVELIAEAPDAHLGLERKFNRDPVSKVFDARASASPSTQGQGGFKISLKLTPKASYVAQLE